MRNLNGNSQQNSFDSRIEMRPPLFDDFVTTNNDNDKLLSVTRRRKAKRPSTMTTNGNDIIDYRYPCDEERNSAPPTKDAVNDVDKSSTGVKQVEAPTTPELAAVEPITKHVEALDDGRTQDMIVNAEDENFNEASVDTTMMCESDDDFHIDFKEEEIIDDDKYNKTTPTTLEHVAIEFNPNQNASDIIVEDTKVVDEFESTTEKVASTSSVIMEDSTEFGNANKVTLVASSKVDNLAQSMGYGNKELNERDKQGAVHHETWSATDNHTKAESQSDATNRFQAKSHQETECNGSNTQSQTGEETETHEVRGKDDSDSTKQETKFRASMQAENKQAQNQNISIAKLNDKQQRHDNGIKLTAPTPTRTNEVISASERNHVPVTAEGAATEKVSEAVPAPAPEAAAIAAVASEEVVEESEATLSDKEVEDATSAVADEVREAAVEPAAAVASEEVVEESAAALSDKEV